MRYYFAKNQVENVKKINLSKCYYLQTRSDSVKAGYFQNQNIGRNGQFLHSQ